MREEIQGNTDSMNDAVAKLNQEDKAIANNIDILTKLLRNPKDKQAQDARIDAHFSVVGLKNTAWKTAQATGALTFMPYAEAQRYSSVYNTQQDFLDQQDKILEDEAQFVGVMRKLDFGHRDVTPEQASAALERFGIWQAHLAYLVVAAKVSAAYDKAFLEGKEGPHEMHYDLH
jgi:hypothetical protein